MKTKKSAEKSPFADAVALWHMSDLYDTAGKNSPLTSYGDVTVGVELKKPEHEASLKRGGDGRVAELRGGYLVAGQEAEGKLSLTGKAMTLCVRLCDPSGKWNTPLFGRYDKDDKHSGILYCVDGDTKPLYYIENGKRSRVTPFYHLFADQGGTRVIRGSKAILEFMWRTVPLDCVVNWCTVRRNVGDPILSDACNGVLTVCVPMELIGLKKWHDVVIRFNGPNLEMFVDGILVDEEWPYGLLHRFSSPFLIGAAFHDGELKAGFHGLIDHVALWKRALTDNEIAILSGGKEEIAKREVEILGKERPSLQYWRPRGYNTYAGDCMPFFHDGTFHLFWLFDRRHHTSKWRLGAHQYAHASTKDLVHWEHHPLAVPINKQWECAMGTGEILYHEGRYYAFYTDCGSRCQFKDKPHEGSGIFMSKSTDGVHFTKVPDLVVPGGDCTIFQDKTTGLFHLLTSGSADDGQRGIIDYVSIDLKSWTKQPELFHDTADACPHHFHWNGWYYFVVGGRFWKSRNPLGPWKSLRPQQLDRLAVPKTGAFTGNRRIFVGWLPDGGWGGDIVFRELVQHEDGSLGTKFPPKMIPFSGNSMNLPFAALTEGASGSSQTIRISAPGSFEAAMLTGVPLNVRITLQVEPEPDSSYFGLCVRGSGNYEKGAELRFEPSKQRVQFSNPHKGAMSKDSDYVIDNVESLDRPFALDIIIKDDIVDVCIDNRRTIITRNKLQGDRLFFFAQNADVAFDSVEIRPLLE